MSSPVILVADDDRSIRTVLEHALKRRGYGVQATDNGDELIRWVQSGAGEAAICDVIMPAGEGRATGLDLLPAIQHSRPGMPVIVISAQSTLMTAVRANQAGAYEYFPKPFDLDALIDCVEKAVAKPYPEMPAQKAGHLFTHPSIIGASATMQQLYRSMARVVNVDLTVMIHGESGTGKELVAKALHDLGPRRNRPFLALNMAAIPKELVESELFGHEKGAFTGAIARKAGIFEQATGGTVFLDEIGDMPLEAQTKLLRVLQQGEFIPVGSARTLKADARIICATHRDLSGAVKQGTFREDLFYRLNVIPLQLPPLRERKEDIPALALHFIEKAKSRGLPDKVLSRDALVVLQTYHWPGNVRELENLVYRLAALVSEQVIGEGAVTSLITAQSESDHTARTLEQEVEMHLRRYFEAHEGKLPPSGLYDRIVPLVERPLIMEALRATGGNQLKAADLLGINRNTLRKKIQELGIRLPVSGQS